MGGEVGVEDICIKKAIYALYASIVDIRSKLTCKRFVDAWPDLAIEMQKELLEALKNKDIAAIDDCIIRIEHTSIDYLTRNELREIASRYGIPYYGNYSTTNLRERIKYEQEQIRILREHYESTRNTKAVDSAVRREGSGDQGSGERTDS